MLPGGFKIAYREADYRTSIEMFLADGHPEARKTQKSGSLSTSFKRHPSRAEERVRRSERMCLWRQPRSDPQHRAADRRFATPRSYKGAFG